MTKEYVGTKIVTAWPQGKEGKEGYAVKYADGYTSWSPKEAFEAAYLELGHISHLPAFHQRLLAEGAELAAKLEKLTGYLQTPEFDEWDNPRVKELLLKQQVVMTDYLNILSARELLAR